jgi:hypothetical protein
MVDLRESSLVPALIAGALLTACGGGDKDTVGPRLEQVRFADAQTLRLVFSEAVVVGQADPAAFRLSLGIKDEGSTVYYALDYDELAADTDGPVSDSDPSAGSASASASGGTDGGDSTTGYHDPTGGYDSGYDPSADDGYYALPAPADSLALPIPTLPISDLGITSVRGVDGKPSEVDLVLAGAVSDTPACDALAEHTVDGSKAGIFLHHRSGTGTIEDAAGNPLAAIAAHWVDASAKAYVEVAGDFPNLDPYLPIPCP